MKYNKGFALIALLAIIVGVLVVGGGAYLLGKNSSHIEYFGNSQCDDSNPSIKLIYPSGGESFYVGEKIKVRWTSCNIQANEKITARINWDKTKDGYGYGTLDDLNIGINDGEEEVVIPEKAYSSNPQLAPVSFSSLGSANLFIFAPNISIFPKNIDCKGTSCMPSPVSPTSETKTPFIILSR